MKDTKTFLLLLVSILLIIVSIFLLWTWTYRVKAIVATVEKNNDAGTPTISIHTNNNAVIADSLQKFYNNVLGSINKSIDSVKNSTDSLKGDLTGKLTEFNELKTEIGTLLKSKLSDADINLAKQKIAELQTKITELRLANSDIERENKRLSSLLAQLSNIPKQTVSQSNFSQPTVDNTKPVIATKAVITGAEVSTADLRMVPFMETDDNKDQETIWAEQTSKFLISLNVKNNSPQNAIIEMMIVITRPDGKVLQKSTWETGTFDTRDGKKIYSYKDRADYAVGETKKMSFWVSSDKFPKGSYTLQVYNKGILVARLTKNLS